MHRFVFVLPILLQLSASQAKLGYYWRDYSANIPEDAFPGGVTSKNETLYIAQALLPSHGLIVTWLKHGDEAVTVPSFGAYKSTFAIKLLCTTNPQNLIWLKTTDKTIKTDAIGKQLVPGGAELSKLLHIGRLWHQGNVLVGKIFEFWADSYVLYYVYNNQELNSKDYEMLVFDKNIQHESPPKIDGRNL